jgi:hydrogenase nickel incorporation protein HypB
MKIIAAQKLLAANAQIAHEVRASLDRAGVYAINVLGAPGAGKTALLEALIPVLSQRLPVAVIEGDQATARDAERIRALGVPVVQINTGQGCHLDARMVSAAVAELDLRAIRLLFIENVGNLICTAEFDLGEHLRLGVLSVPEGDDKIAKYPTMFSCLDALALNKTDLLPHLEFDVTRVASELRRLRRTTKVFRVSARSGAGIAALAKWLAARAAR